MKRVSILVLLVGCLLCCFSVGACADGPQSCEGPGCAEICDGEQCMEKDVPLPAEVESRRTQFVAEGKDFRGVPKSIEGTFSISCEKRKTDKADALAFEGMYQVVNVIERPSDCGDPNQEVSVDDEAPYWKMERVLAGHGNRLRIKGCQDAQGTNCPKEFIEEFDMATTGALMNQWLDSTEADDAPTCTYSAHTDTLKMTEMGAVFQRYVTHGAITQRPEGEEGCEESARVLACGSHAEYSECRVYEEVVLKRL